MKVNYAIFTDDILRRSCIAVKDDLHKDPEESFEADSWYEASLKLSPWSEGKKVAFICLPLHAAYMTLIDMLDIGLIINGKKTVKPWGEKEEMTLIYDPIGMERRKMLNRELTRYGVIEDIVAGSLVVIPADDKESFESAYENFGKGQAFIYDRKTNDIKTIKCSGMALAVLRENNISIIA